MRSRRKVKKEEWRRSVKRKQKGNKNMTATRQGNFKHKCAPKMKAARTPGTSVNTA
jgi:hypothetical protein